MVALLETLSLTPSYIVGILCLILALAFLLRRSPLSGSGLGLPGLPWVPILGSIPFMRLGGKNRHEYFTELSLRHGKIFSFWLGSSYVVVLNGYDFIREALLNQATVFSGRPFPQQFVRRLINPHMKGIIEPTYTPAWKQNRDTSLAILRDFGFGRSILQNTILDEATELVSWLTQQSGPTDPCDVLTTAVGNVICSVCAGKRFPYKDCSDFLGAVEAIDSTSILMARLHFFQYLPFLSLLKLLPAVSRKSTAIEASHSKLLQFVRQLTKTQSSEENNFVSAYKKKVGHGETEEDLVYITRDLLIAGTETTKTVLLWSFVYMANNPHIQTKVQEELDIVLCEGEQVKIEDKPRLPFTEAVVLEVQRLAVLAPLAAPHTTLQDTNLAGFDIPANTTVFVNLWSVLRDPKLWPEPDVFRPERFLTEDGTVIYKSELVPFSLGKRKCLGEVLARQELFLFFSEILRNFTIRLPPGVGKLDEEGTTFTSRTPLPFKVVFEKRKTFT